jgi:hypothetical protein
MSRFMADCRRWPSETNCSLVIIAEEEEVVRAAAEPAASVHGQTHIPLGRAHRNHFPDSCPIAQMLARSRARRAAAQAAALPLPRAGVPLSQVT